MKTKWKITIILSAVVIAGILGVVIWKMNDTSPPEPTPPVVNSPTMVPTDSPTPAPTDSPTPLPTPTLSPTPVPTDTPTPEPTPTEELTPTEEPSPTDEPLPTDSPTPEPTDSPTPVPTNTATPVPTKEPTKAPTNTVTPKPTKAPTPTFTPTPVPTPEQPYDMWVRVLEPTVFSAQSSGYILNEIDRNGLKLGDKVTVVKSNFNGAPDGQDCLMEIKWGSGTALMWKSELSKSYVEPVWAEPRERKDVSDLLMAKVNEYRQSKGVRKIESPYVYYDVTNPGLGNRLSAQGIRVAKKSCMEGTANHEGGQIGTGIYGGYSSPANASEIAQRLFDNWYNSPAHNANMLMDGGSEDDWVNAGIMTVVEWYNGNGYQYCAIMSHAFVPRENLPDGLE